MNSVCKTLINERDKFISFKPCFISYFIFKLFINFSLRYNVFQRRYSTGVG